MNPIFGLKASAQTVGLYNPGASVLGSLNAVIQPQMETQMKWPFLTDW